MSTQGVPVSSLTVRDGWYRWTLAGSGGRSRAPEATIADDSFTNAYRQQAVGPAALSRVLVTGAGGYVGTVLVPELLAAGHAVRALDRFFFGADLLAPHERLELVKADTRLLEPGHLADIDAVVDLAALSNDPSGERFAAQTWAINHAARVRCARLAAAAGVARYVLPSSCSVYGFHPDDVPCDEDAAPSPLTTYAAANLRAEADILPLAGDAFCVTVLRQATLYGASPRMRFDLAVNGMAWGAWSTGVLPLMRDGTQWRPLMHVRDAASAIRFVLGQPPGRVNGRVLNAGPRDGNVRLAGLAARRRRPAAAGADRVVRRPRRALLPGRLRPPRGAGLAGPARHRGGRRRDRGPARRRPARALAAHHHPRLVRRAGAPPPRPVGPG